jgi:hypothetical protein
MSAPGAELAELHFHRPERPSTTLDRSLRPGFVFSEEKGKITKYFVRNCLFLFYCFGAWKFNEG